MVIGEVALFEDVEVNVTVKFGDKNGTGKVTLYVNDNPVVVDEEELDENGTATLTIAADKIKAGENTIVAEFTSTNGNYSANSTSQTINVAKVTPTITITVNNVKIGEPAYLAITVQDGATTKPTGFITVKLGDKTYPTVPLTDGATQVTIPAADINEVAEYSVEVTYDPNGDVNYNANSTVFKFNVSYYDMEITVSDIANKTVGNNITFTIKAKGDKEFSQNFTVTIKDANGETVDTLSIALDKGVTGKEVQFNLTKGVYTAVISYPGDENYAANSTTTDKFSVAGIIENLTIEIAEVTYPNNATAVVNASVDGDYNITIDGIDKEYTVTVSQGTGSVTLDILAAKDGYQATVKSLIDGYNQKIETTAFNVKPGKVEGARLTIVAVTYPEHAIAFVTSDVDGNYTIVSENGLEGYDVEVINGTGNVTFTQDIRVGSYRFSLVTPTDNSNYTSYKADTQRLVVSKGTVDVNWTVEDVYYNAQANVVINASVGGTYTINVFNSTGDVVNTTTVDLAKDEAQTLPINLLTPGTYTVNVTATIANYNDVELTKDFEVKTGIVYYNITVADITYGEKVKFTINTNVVAINATEQLGYEVFLNDENITYTNGNVEFEYETILTAGTYTIKVVPKAGDDAFTYYEFGSEYNTTTLTVKPAATTFNVQVTSSVEYPNNVTINVTDSSFEGNYTVVIGEDTYIIEVGADKKGSVNITGLPVGGYIAYITSDNENYTVVTKTATFSVNYGPIEPEIESITVAYNAPVLVALTSNADGVYTITVNPVYDPRPFTLGKGSVIRDGNDCVLFTCGIMLEHVIDAANILRRNPRGEDLRPDHRRSAARLRDDHRR